MKSVFESGSIKIQFIHVLILQNEFSLFGDIEPSIQYAGKSIQFGDSGGVV